MSVKLNDSFTRGFVKESELEYIAPQAEAALSLLKSKKGPGSDFVGWVDLPVSYDRDEYARVKDAALRIRSMCSVFVVIGIGGSYLGARAAIEFLKSPNYNAMKKDTPDIYYTGNSISSTALAELIDLCEGKDVSINMISKS
ncbi:MAG TPA: glucose-6-phosphate isomerase, partial [Bacillota bacterium]|nr:glucose-6-phosphate isomerase [Bacillota bacterium]